MFTRPEVIIPTQVLIDQQKRIAGAPARFQAEVERSLVPASQARTDATINTPRGAHKRPTDWQSQRQRRWWFAVGVHRWQGRTGTTNKWKIIAVRITDGGEIRATNSAPGAKYVFGHAQQRMHYGTWMHRDTYENAESAALTRDTYSAWQRAQRLK